MTGMTNFGGELLPKRLQLLREVVPAQRVGVLKNPTNFNFTAPTMLERWTGAARSLSIDLTWADAQSPGELAGAFAEMTQARVEAVLVETDAMFFSQRARIVDLAATHQLPAVYAEREFADAGGLMAYAPNGTAIFRSAATYVDKILKGANPGDLPIERPTKLELVINLKTAKALGLTIPQSLMLRADEVIQ
jgi:putative ABC transport system substrate-binding protein